MKTVAKLKKKNRRPDPDSLSAALSWNTVIDQAGETTRPRTKPAKKTKKESAELQQAYKMMWIADVKHLQGKHDQASHRPKGTANLAKARQLAFDFSAAPVAKPKPKPKPKPKKNWRELEGEEKKAAVRQMAKEAREKILNPDNTGASERLSKMYDLEDSYQKANDEVDTMGYTMTRLKKNWKWDEYNAMVPEHNKLIDKANAVGVKLATARHEMNADMRKPLYTDKPSKVNNKKPRFRKTDSRKAGLDRGIDEFQKMVEVGVDSPDFKMTVKKGGRGRASAFGEDIFLTTGSGPQTAIHEMGHWLESGNAKVKAAAHRFLDRRTRGEVPEQMGPGYGWNEKTKKDQFVEKYMGKQYISTGKGSVKKIGKGKNVKFERRPPPAPKGEKYATEILSMGLQLFYKRPAELARKDPEYFDFIFAIVRGVEL